MTDNIKLPPMPEGVFGSSGALWALIDKWWRADPGLNSSVAAKAIDDTIARLMNEHAREAVRLNAQGVPDGIPLNIIRKWPDGFNDRLQHVWLDVVSFIPSVKLYDLQRVLAEFGLRMEVYEDAPAAPQPAQPLTDEQITAGWRALPYDIEDRPEPWAFREGVRFAERKHLGVEP